MRFAFCNKSACGQKVYKTTITILTLSYFAV